MNRIFFYLIGLLFLITSCQKNNLSSKLEGKWQLKTVEQDGTVTSVDTVWYNFQSRSLFMYQLYMAEIDSFRHWYGFKLQPEENTIEIELVPDNSSIGVAEFLPYTDWENDKRTFFIESISGKKLIMNSENKIYNFRKFE